MKQSKSVKQLSQELGISRQALLKRISKLPTNRQPTKDNRGAYQITAEIESLLVAPTTETNNQTDNKQPTSDNLDTMIEMLKEELASKNEQIRTLSKLVDQQQQLSLISNKKIELLEIELKEKEMNQELEKKSFFDLFKKHKK